MTSQNQLNMQIVTFPPFDSDESLSDENSSQNGSTSPQLSKPLIPPITSSTNLLLKDNSPTITNDNSSFKQQIKTHQNELPETNHAIHLKTNLFYLILHLTETIKLIITSDTNQKRIIVNTYHLQNFATIIH